MLLIPVLSLAALGLTTPPPVVHEEKPDQPPGVPAALVDDPGQRTPTMLPAVGTMFAPVQVNVDEDGNNIGLDAANEPSIGVDPSAPNRIVIGWRQFDTISSSFRQAGMAYSHDGGRTWNNTGPLEPGQFRSDPVLAADSEGRFYYYSLSTLESCEFFISEDGGVTWTPPIDAFGGDKQWFVLDECEGKGRAKVYAYWSVFAGCCGDDAFIRSFDGGLTYTPPIEILGTPIFGTLAIGADEALYIGGVNPADFSQFVVARTANARDETSSPTFETTFVDLGGTLTLGAGPNPGGLLGQAWIASDRSSGPHSGNIYLLASTSGNDGVDPMEVRIVRSEDNGATWSAPVKVNDDPSASHAWQWFGTMAVAPNGRIDVIWNDTRDDPTVNLSTLYYAFSVDGGETFSKNEPISLPFKHFKGYPQQNKLGDYYQLVSDNVGAHLAWAATFNNEQDVYYLRIGDYDCNGNDIGDAEDIASGAAEDCNANGIPDSCEIAAGTLPDEDGDGVPDECGIPGDLDRNGVVDFTDLLTLLANWGPCPLPPPGDCLGDINGDGDVGFEDLLTLLANWTTT